jgi:hypothetical protein
VDIRPYEDGLMVFSDFNPGNCDSFGVDISGSDNDWECVVYAARSQVEYQGSSGFTLSGSIVANTLYIRGSGFTLSAPTSTAPGDTTVLLSGSEPGRLDHYRPGGHFSDKGPRTSNGSPSVWSSSRGATGHVEAFSLEGD